MSRATTTSSAAGQLTTSSRHIFVTFITKPDGKKTQVMSSAPLNDDSIRINTRPFREKNGKPNNPLLLLTAMGLSCLYGIGDSPNPYLELSVIDKLIHYRGTKPDVWSNIFNFLPGLTPDAGDYALSIINPSFFRRIDANPDSFIIVDAAIRGQEDMVLNILRADPSYLLRKAKVKNSVGIEYEVTPLQAAIMANDAQLAEKMREHFAHLTTDLKGNPIDGLAEMEKQFKEIYTKSLKNYLQKQEAEFTRLFTYKSGLSDDDAQHTEIDDKLKKARENCDTYGEALIADPQKNPQQIIQTIFEAHTQAQKDNEFDFEPYADAIANASQAELDDAINLTGALFTQTNKCLDTPFDKLTLVEKLNRFREEFVKHMQSEIIFNPNHIASALTVNKEKYFALDRAGTDADYKKRTVIFSQLVGFSQRVASEPTKQDLRQGTYYLTEEKELRTRPSRFNDLDSKYNIVRNSLADVSRVSSVIDGLGFKFGGGACAEGRRGIRSQASLFKTYVEQKHQAFRTYAAAKIAQPACMRNDVR